MQRLSGLRVRRRWSARTASAVCRCKTPSDLQKAALHALDIPLGCQRCRCATTTDGTSHSPYSTEQRCTAGGAVAACASLEPRKWRLPERDAARAISEPPAWRKSAMLRRPGDRRRSAARPEDVTGLADKWAMGKCSEWQPRNANSEWRS